MYATDIGIRFTGLGWKSFSQNGWNLYDIFVVTGTFATTIPIILGTSSQTAIQLQKLFLVSIAFKLVQKNNSLNQLFKTAMSVLTHVHWAHVRAMLKKVTQHESSCDNEHIWTMAHSVPRMGDFFSGELQPDALVRKRDMATKLLSTNRGYTTCTT